MDSLPFPPPKVFVNFHSEKFYESAWERMLHTPHLILLVHYSFIESRDRTRGGLVVFTRGEIVIFRADIFKLVKYCTLT